MLTCFSQILPVAFPLRLLMAYGIMLLTAAVAVTAVVPALHRWQREIYRREHGEPPGGFPVIPPDERPKR